jgi:hypothetical protein
MEPADKKVDAVFCILSNHQQGLARILLNLIVSLS